MKNRNPPGPGAPGWLKVGLTLAASLPLAFVGARELGLVGPELRWVAVAAAPVLALLTLLAFEPPRSWSPLAWLRQLRARLAPGRDVEAPSVERRRQPRRATPPPPLVRAATPPSLPAGPARPAAAPAPEPLVVVDPHARPSALLPTEEHLPLAGGPVPPYPEARPASLRLASLGRSGEVLPLEEPPAAHEEEEATQRLPPARKPVVTPQPALAVARPPSPASAQEEETVRQLPPLDGPPPPAVAPVSLRQALAAARNRTPRPEGYRSAYEAEQAAAPTRSLPTAKPEPQAAPAPVAPAVKRRPSR